MLRGKLPSSGLALVALALEQNGQSFPICRKNTAWKARSVLGEPRRRKLGSASFQVPFGSSDQSQLLR